MRSRDQDHPGQHGKTQSLLNTKISLVWWHTQVVPATWEAEAGESLEPRKQKLQQAKIALRAASWCQSKTVSKKEKKSK